MTNNEHFKNLYEMLKDLDNINSVIDAGSGKTSLNYLTYYYPGTIIDAICYPTDDRKINSINENVKGNYNLIKADLCNNEITKNYDLVIAHLLLGEAVMFGHTFKEVLSSLFKIKGTYYLIYDFKEDPIVNFKYLEEYLNKNNYQIIKEKEFLKEEPQTFTKFIGKTYKAYLVKNVNK